jgi:Ca2+-binding EF-hand superfamily protein
VFERVMIAIGQKPSDEELREMIRTVDLDGSDSIEIDEFLTMMAKKKIEEQKTVKEEL